MRIPLWIWIVIGLSVLSWIIPDGIPGEEFLLPAIAIIGLLLRRRLLRNFYQQQYQHYKGKQGTGTGTGTGNQNTGQNSGNNSNQSQSSNNFYNRFRNWQTGFQQTQTETTTKDPYEVLGINKGASQDEIKKAYREKLKKFHPDVVANLKLGPEYKEMFEEKTREIQKAYEQLVGK